MPRVWDGSYYNNLSQLIGGQKTVKPYFIHKGQADLIHFFAKRDYDFIDAAGNDLVCYGCCFSMIDMNTRKLARIPKDMAEAYQPEHVRKIPRAPEVTPFDEPVRRFCTGLFCPLLDIDSNHHVNIFIIC